MATGHLEKRSKSSWTIVIELGRDPVTGKRKRITKSVKCNSKKAKKIMHEMLHEIETGTFVKPTELTVAEYLKQWLKNYCETNLAPSTFASYKMIIEKHLIPNIGGIKLPDLQPMHLQSYYTKALKKGRANGKGGLSPRTVEYHHRVLREALNHAVKWQIIKRNVADAVNPPKQRKPEIKVLDREEVKKLLLVASEQSQEDYEIIYTAIYTGMRRGEIIALRWQDVDLEKGVAQIRRSMLRLPDQGYVFREPKTKRARRQIALPQSVVEIFKSIKKRQAKNRLQSGGKYKTEYDLVFCREDGEPLDPDTVSHRFKDIAKKAGFTELRFHDLRHTHATLLLKEGVHPKVVQERLGHKTITLTLDTYSHVLPGLQEEAAKKLENILSPTKGQRNGNG